MYTHICMHACIYIYIYVAIAAIIDRPQPPEYGFASHFECFRVWLVFRVRSDCPPPEELSEPLIHTLA